MHPINRQSVVTKVVLVDGSGTRHTQLAVEVSDRGAKLKGLPWSGRGEGVELLFDDDAFDRPVRVRATVLRARGLSTVVRFDSIGPVARARLWLGLAHLSAQRPPAHFALA